MSDIHVRDAVVTQRSWGRMHTFVTLPEPDGTTDHELTGTCWCQPIVEDRPPEDRRFIHRASLDVPHIREES